MTTDQELLSVLKTHFGFDQFLPLQAEIVSNVLANNDSLVLMPTGAGKSLCYQLPAVIHDGYTVVVSPLIALMKDQVDAIRANGVPAAFVNSTHSLHENENVLTQTASGDIKILYVAPERLATPRFQRFLKAAQPALIAIDEAHCISEWGHDFRPDYRNLKILRREFPSVPLIALTATATEEVRRDIVDQLRLEDAGSFVSSFNRPNLTYSVLPKQRSFDELMTLMQRHKNESAIIYCFSRKDTEQLSTDLSANGYPALPYHAGLDSALRRSTQEKFIRDEVPVIVATIAFGMGIDKPDVRFVIHFDMPKSLEGYYQETGRAGRDDGEGKCLAFYQYKDIEKLEKFMKGKPVAEQEVGRQLLLETVTYAESAMCRRQQLLHYFGERYAEENCKNCDNCNNPKERVEAKQEMVQVLNTILNIKEKFKAKHIVNTLMGVTTSEIKSYKHDELKEFGVGCNEEEQFWNAVVRQGLILELLIKDIESYGLLRLSEKGHAFLANPHFTSIF